MKRVAVCGVSAICTLGLHGCGGGGGGGSPTPAPAPGPGPTPAPAPPGKLGELKPLRGVSYQALPCTAGDFGGGSGKCQLSLPGHDMMQTGYSKQWGPEGRDDLGAIKMYGGNAIRTYKSAGSETMHNHGDFLDRAEEIGLHVMPGFLTQMVCPNFDCYQSWKDAATAALKNGFKKGDGYHPAIAMIVLMDEPDALSFAPEQTKPVTCPMTDADPPQYEAWCRVKAALSALDGLLAAEKEAGITDAKAKITITWGFTIRDSLDKTLTGTDSFLWGFQDMKEGVKNPQHAKYEPKTSTKELTAAFESRWVHGLKTNNPWGFLKEKISAQYAQFKPANWFIGEFRGGDTALSASDLKDMNEYATTDPNFLGMTAFEFLDDYQAGPDATALGLNGINDKGKTTWPTEDVCETDVYRPDVNNCAQWVITCLTAAKDASRLKTLVEAWGGTADVHGNCPAAAEYQAQMTELAV